MLDCLPVVPLVKQMTLRSSGFGGFDEEHQFKTLKIIV